jgi:hypothetical protein
VPEGLKKEKAGSLAEAGSLKYFLKRTSPEQNQCMPGSEHLL